MRTLSFAPLAPSLGPLFTLLLAGCGAPPATPAAPSAAAPGALACARRAPGVGAAPAEPQRTGSTVALARLGAQTVAYVADEDDRTLHTVDLGARTELSTTRLAGAPSQLLVAKDGRVFVALRDQGVVEVLEPTAEPSAPLERRCVVEAAAEPVGLAVTPDDATLLVTSGWGAALTGYETAGLTRSFRVALARDPRAVVVSDDGAKAFVTHLVGSRMTVVDLGKASHPARRIDLTGTEQSPFARSTLDQLFDGDAPDRQACQGFALAKTVAPGGRILAPQVLVDPGRSEQRTSGYGSGGAFPPEVGDVAVVDDATEHPLGASLTVRLDPQRGPECLLPRAAVVDPVSGELLVACLGIDSLVAYDASAADPRAAETRRFRVAAGPTGVAVDAAGRRAVVWSQFDHTLDVVSLDGKASARAAGGVPERPPVERVALSRVAQPPATADLALGRKLFHTTTDPRISRDGRACASCHPDGRDDALTWSTPDGPRQTLMLAGRLDKTGPYGWMGTSATVLEHVGHTFERLGGQGLKGAEREALLAYLGAMAAPPAGAGPGTDALARRGEALFAAESTGCASCHVPGDGFTDHRKHDIGSGDRGDEMSFDTPSLRFVGGTAPYFHDGRYPTLRAVLTGADGKMGHTKQLSRDDMDALEAYLRTL